MSAAGTWLATACGRAEHQRDRSGRRKTSTPPTYACRVASTRDELEADLLANWAPAQLAVYGDFLQTEGDPRGELIAIDLAGVATPERDVRRSELLTAIVGGSALSWLHRYVRFKLELGFVDMKLGEVGRGAGHDAEQALLDGPLGRYLRTVTIAGGEAHIRAGVANLACRHHRWLRTLSIHYKTSASRSLKPIISRKQTAALIAATPNLETLEVDRDVFHYDGPARPVFTGFVHPNVRAPKL